MTGNSSPSTEGVSVIGICMALGLVIGGGVALALGNVAFAGGGLVIGLALGAAIENRSKSHPA